MCSIGSLAQPTLNLTVNTLPPGCGYSNGIINGTASGGTPPYLYSLDDPRYQYNSGLFSRKAGNYNMTVTDATGQTATVPVVLVDNPTMPRVRIESFVRTSACDVADGSVTLIAEGGQAPYEYSIDRVNWQNSPTFNNLTSGAVHFLVRDANGCINTEKPDNYPTIIFLKPFACNADEDLVTISSSNNGTCNNDGHIIVIPKRGGPYVYSIDGINYQTSPNFNNLGTGLYTLFVKDLAGQIRVYSITFIRICNPSINLTTTNSDCGRNNGSFTLNVTGDRAPFRYSIDGFNFQASNTFSNLSKGNYNYIILDNEGNQYTGTAEIFDNNCPALTLTATNESCARNDGSITATPTRGAPPFQYSIDGTNFQNGNVFNGLAAGNYTITIKDAVNNTATSNIVVRSACITVTATHTDVVCSNMNGTITATAANGTAPYQYSINGINFQVSNVFNGLAAGTYTLTVKDFAGLTANTNVIITDAPSPVIRVNTIPTSCTNNDGVITITGTGGTAPLSYSIDGINYQAGNVFNNIVSGPYSTWVKDANGCGAGTTVAVVVNCPTITPVITHETCGNADGSIVINVTNTNGFGPYEYSLDGINFQTSNTFSNLAANIYNITIRDALGFRRSISVSITNNCPLVTAVATNSTCGSANGSITATGANGTAPYSFSIDGINFQAGNVFTNLAAANYIVSIKDARGTIRTTNVVINNIAGPQLTAQSTAATCLNNDGKITLIASAGTAPYQYSLDGTGFGSNSIFSTISSGSHTGLIKDANGCTSTQIITVALNNNFVIQPVSPATICEAKSTRLNITTNGTNFSWSPAAGLDNTQTGNPVASPTETTLYTVTVSLGVCSKPAQVLVNVDKAPIANAGQGTTICYGQNAQLNGAGGQHYSWKPSTNLSNAQDAAPTVTKPTSSITYSLQVTDDKGCTSLNNSSVTVTVTPPPKVFAGNDTSIVMNQPFQLQAMDVNNSGFVSYVWSPPYGLNNYSIAAPVATLDRDIIYQVRAITQGGCEGSDNISIKVYRGPEIYVPSAFTPGNDGKNDILRVVPVGIKKFKYFIVYNRWGNQVFYTTDPNKGWDGMINHILGQTGVFVWLAEGIDEKDNLVRRKGTVTLIR